MPDPRPPRDRAPRVAVTPEAGDAHLRDLAESLAGVGRWRFEFGGDRVVWSGQVFRIYGMPPPEEQDVSTQTALSCYAEEDRIEIARLFTRARETGEGYEMRTSIRRLSDGEERFVISRAVVERDADGALVAIAGVIMDVTDAHRATLQLAESEARFRMLAEVAHDVVAHFDAKGVFTYVSPSSAKIVGYAPDELIGRTPYDFILPEAHAAVAATFAAYAAAGPNAPPPLLEYPARRKDGAIIHLEARPRSLWSADGRLLGFQDAARDVTAAREAQSQAAAAAAVAEAANRAVAESEARYRMMADHATDLILRFGPGGLITYCSPSARHWGFEPSEIEGRLMRDFLHPDDQSAQDAMIAALFTGQTPDLTQDRSLRAQLRDGRVVWLEGAPSIIRDEAGSPVEVVSVFRDVTARKTLQAELVLAKERAEAAAEAKAEFLANMSHELRTPLTAVLGFAQLAADQPGLTDDTRRHLSRVRNAGKALLSAVNDILDLSKLEAGRIELSVHPVDVADLARETLDLFSADAAARGLALRAEGLETLPAEVRVDPDRLRQVLLNLLGNALKFTDHGGVTLSARYDAGAGALAFAIADTGCGVPVERLDSLFQRFNQIEGSVARRHGGTGLGLAICKRLVEAMGGEVSVESRPGRGSTFGFTLAAPAVTPRAAEPAAPETEGFGVAGARVLAVDDNAANRELIGAVLTPMGVEVTLADSGSAALALAAAASFDVVLLDLRMPGMDGFETAARLRGGATPNRRTPILAFSADALAALSDDFDGLVAKPLTMVGLLASLSAALQLGAREATIRRLAALA